MTASHDPSVLTGEAGAEARFRHVSLFNREVLGLSGFWLMLVVVLGAAGMFLPAPGEPPLVLMLAVVAPPLLFLAAHWLVEDVRAWVAGVDLGLVTALQSWRVAGALFLALWFYGHLPAAFALPAGLGDVAVGIAAPFVAVAVMRRSRGWKTASRGLLIAGLADFAVALVTGILTDEGKLLHVAGGPTSELMNVLPLALIPTFLVPGFVILHLIAWIRIRNEMPAG